MANESLDDIANSLEAGDSDNKEVAAQAADPIKNLKAEFARKQSNTEAMLASTQAQLDQLMQQMQSKQAPASTKSAKDLLYDAPDQFAADVEARAAQKAQEIVTRQLQSQQALNQTVSEIQSKYKEFSDVSSEASQLAVSKMAKMPAHLRGTAEGARLALLDVAAELELVPAGKKSQSAQQSSGDEYVGSGGSSKSVGSKQRSKEDSLQRQFASLLTSNLTNIDSKEFEKNFERAQKRTKWSEPV